MEEGTIQNRDSFLNHIADKLGRKRRTKVDKPLYSKQPQWNVLCDKTMEELVQVLKNQCMAIHTDVKEATIEDLPDVVDQVLHEYQAERIITWDDPRFRQFGLNTLLERTDVSVWGEESSRDMMIRKAEEADVGVTFADYTLAESATVVLKNGGGKGQSVSLLPTYYIAIILRSTLVPRMSQAAKAIHEHVESGERIPSCINFISGPSNSGDIEFNLVVGVHGPVKACYVLVDDRKA